MADDPSKSAGARPYSSDAPQQPESPQEDGGNRTSRPSFTVPRPQDVPGSTPPPGRRSNPPGGDALLRSAGIDAPGASLRRSGPPRRVTRTSSPHLASPPAAASAPRSPTEEPQGQQASAPKAPAAPDAAPVKPESAQPASAQATPTVNEDREGPPPSSVVVTPMRIIDVAGPTSTAEPKRGAVPSLPGSESPTPLEVPIARFPPRNADAEWEQAEWEQAEWEQAEWEQGALEASSIDEAEVNEDEDVAVPLRRVSQPPPAPQVPAPVVASTTAKAPEPPTENAPPPAVLVEPVTPVDSPRKSLPPEKLAQMDAAVVEAIPPTTPSGPPPAGQPDQGGPPPVVPAASPAAVSPSPAHPAPPRARQVSQPRLAPPPTAQPRSTSPSAPTLELDDAASVVEVEFEIAPDSEERLESLSEEDLTEVVTAPRRRKPPPPPPLRTGFTDGTDDGTSKRKGWWEDLFDQDFARSIPDIPGHQLGEEIRFIENMLGLEQGAHVLDLACGNGLHSVALAQHGYSVLGLDFSHDMLHLASERALSASGVRFTHGDMREIGFEQMFDGVICWNASFGYFEREKNETVLHNVFHALKPGGSFLLDVPNRDFVISQQPAQNWFEGNGCDCMDDMYLDFITSRLWVKRTIMFDDGRNREFNYSMRLYSLHELGRILRDVGFRVTQLSGDVSTPGVFLGSTSPRLIVLVTKPEA